MPKCIIDGKEFEFKPGESVIQIADRNGVEIPRFCYHPAMTVVAQCRMCAVEIEKMPKLQTACSTPAGDGMIVHTKSEKVRKHQSSVMEFLLINHPLDCPVCDESGECRLQDYSFDYGAPDSRYEEHKRTFVDEDMGPVIKKNMNRCIHCTLCIRFCDEITGKREIVALQRGNDVEIVTVDGLPLTNDYSGCLADVCPTGSLTTKDFRFKKRVWFLKKTPSVCEGCSQGCNIIVEQDENVLYRTRPRENQEVNKWWMCDEGRFLYHYAHSPARVLDPAVQMGGQLKQSDWTTALGFARERLKGRVLFLVGTDLTLEEMTVIQEFSSRRLKNVEIYHYGTEGVKRSKEDVAEDKLLRRTSKTANLHGAEKLGIKPWEAQEHFDTAIVFRGGRAQMPTIPQLRQSVSGSLIGMGVFNRETVTQFDVVLPGLSAYEKDGTVVNWQGKEQRIKRALQPLGHSRGLPEVLVQLG